MEPKTDKCPDCGSMNTVRHTDKELREKEIYIVQCWNCDRLWEVDWDEEFESMETIVGFFFHSFEPNGEVDWQGQVVGTQEGGYLIVELYEWISGINITRKIVPLSIAEQWTFYKTLNEMRDSYDGLLKR